MDWNNSIDVLVWMQQSMPSTWAGMWPQQREQVAERVWRMYRVGAVNDVLDAVDCVVDSLAEIQSR